MTSARPVGSTSRPTARSGSPTTLCAARSRRSSSAPPTRATPLGFTSPTMAPPRRHAHRRALRWADAAPAAPAAAVPARGVGGRTRAGAGNDGAPRAAARRRRHRPQSPVVRLTFAPDGDGAAPPVVAYHFPRPSSTEAAVGGSRNLRITKVVQTAPDSATVAVAADATAAFVTLESLAVVGAFSGGAFTLLAGGAPSPSARASTSPSTRAPRPPRPVARRHAHARERHWRRAKRRGGGRPAALRGRGALAGLVMITYVHKFTLDGTQDSQRPTPPGVPLPPGRGLQVAVEMVLSAVHHMKRRAGQLATKAHRQREDPIVGRSRRPASSGSPRSRRARRQSGGGVHAAVLDAGDRRR